MAARQQVSLKSPSSWLYVGSNRERDLLLGFVNNNKVVKRKDIKSGANTENLLVNIDAFLKSLKARPHGVVFGGENLSFSQERILASVVNTLAYVWQVPVAVSKTRFGKEIKPKANLLWREEYSLVY